MRVATALATPLLFSALCGARLNGPGASVGELEGSSLGLALRDLVKEEAAARAELAAQRDDALAALAATATNASKAELSKARQEAAHLRRALHANGKRLDAALAELERARLEGNETGEEATELRRDLVLMKKRLNNTLTELENLKAAKNASAVKLQHDKAPMMAPDAASASKADEAQRNLSIATSAAQALNRQLLIALKNATGQIAQRDQDVARVRAEEQKEAAELGKARNDIEAKIQMIKELRKQLQSQEPEVNSSHESLLKVIKEIKQKLQQKDSSMRHSQNALKVAAKELKALLKKMGENHDELQNLVLKMRNEEQELVDTKVMLKAIQRGSKNHRENELRQLQKELHSAREATLAKDGELKAVHMKLDEAAKRLAEATEASKANAQRSHDAYVRLAQGSRQAIAVEEEKLHNTEQELAVEEDKLHKMEQELAAAKASTLDSSAMKNELEQVTASFKAAQQALMLTRAKLASDDLEIKRSREEVMKEEQEVEHFAKTHAQLFSDVAGSTDGKEKASHATTGNSTESVDGTDSADADDTEGKTRSNA